VPTDTESPASTAPLTGRIARGDDAAFAEFYELWFDRVFAMARSISRRDESFCLDIVQDCMMRVVRSIRPLPDENAVAAWMGRVVFSTAIDRIRVEHRRRRREREVAVQSGTAASPDVEDERVDWLRLRLAELPEVDRELLLQRFEHGKTLAAVGAARGLSGNAVHGRIYRILSKLRLAAAEVFHG